MRPYADIRPKRRPVAARGWRPTRRSGLRRRSETRRMQYGRRRAKERACLRRSRVKRTPTTVGWALEEADGNVMDSVFRLGRKSLVLFLWHIPVDVRLGGGGCREDFRPQAETRGRRANRRGAADAQKGIGRLTWEEAPRCKVLPSLVYKRKGRPHVKGLPILS